MWLLKRGYWRLTGQLSPVCAKCITMNGTKKILDRLGLLMTFLLLKELMILIKKNLNQVLKQYLE